MNSRILLILFTMLVAPALAFADVTVALKGAKPKETHQWKVYSDSGKEISNGATRKNPFDIPTAMFGRGYQGPYTIAIFQYYGGPDERGQFKSRKVGEGTIQRAAGNITINCN